MAWFDPSTAETLVPGDTAVRLTVADLAGNATTVEDATLVFDLEAPEPFARAMELAMALAPGDSVRVRTPRTPRALLPRLAERGFEYTVAEEPRGTAVVTIRRPAPKGERG